MQRLLTTCILCFSFSLAFAGPKLGDRVEEMLGRIDSCASAEMVGSIVDEYEFIITDYATDWRSYYWLAYGNLKKADYCFDKDNRDRALDAGLKYINRARLLKLQHAETDILEALLLSKKIEIDPETRENKYAYLVKDLLANAFKLDQLNPRYYLVKGVEALADTANNAANKKSAISYLESAEKLFGPHDKGADEADPTWGFTEAQLYLNVLLPGRETYYNKKGEKVNSLLDAEADFEMKDIEKQLKKEQKQKDKEAKKLAKSAKKAEKSEDADKSSTSSKKSSTKSNASKKKDSKKDSEEEETPKKKKKRNLP